MKVLILEDEPNIRRAYIRNLKAYFPDMEFCECATVPDAIYQTNEFKPDVIISDWNLRQTQHGGDFFNWISTNKVDLVKRYLFCTGTYYEAIRLTHLVFEKPVSTNSLIQLMKMWQNDVPAMAV